MSSGDLACSLTKACNCINDGNCTCKPGQCNCKCASTEGSKCKSGCCAGECKCSSGGPCICGDNCSCPDCKCKTGCKKSASHSHGSACART